MITLTQANSDKGLKLETSVESTKGYLNFTYLTLKSHKQSHDTRGCLLHHLTRRVCSKSQGLRTGTRNCIASSSNNATHRHTPALPTCSLLNIRIISVPKWLTKETDSCSAGALRGLFIRTKEFHLVLLGCLLVVLPLLGAQITVSYRLHCSQPATMHYH